jgi:hypothetical protein
VVELMADKLNRKDSFADADAVFEQTLEHSTADVTGAIVSNMREGFDIQNYTGFWPQEMTAVKGAQHRQHLKSRGYRPLDPEVDQEIVVAGLGCEVWIRSIKAREIAIQDRRDHARCEGRWDGKGGNPHGARTWVPMQKGRSIGQKHWKM